MFQTPWWMVHWPRLTGMHERHTGSRSLLLPRSGRFPWSQKDEIWKGSSCITKDKTSLSQYYKCNIGLHEAVSPYSGKPNRIAQGWLESWVFIWGNWNFFCSGWNGTDGTDLSRSQQSEKKKRPKWSRWWRGSWELMGLRRMGKPWVAESGSRWHH